MNPRLYTPAELAEILQISERAVRRNTPGWPHINLGPRTKRFTEDHLNTILAKHENLPQPPRAPRQRRTI